jgi:hypothetical protein
VLPFSELLPVFEPGKGVLTVETDIFRAETFKERGGYD